MSRSKTELSEAERVSRDAVSASEVFGELESATAAAVMSVAASEDFIREVVAQLGRVHSPDETRADSEAAAQEDANEPMVEAINAVAGSLASVVHAIGEPTDRPA